MRVKLLVVTVVLMIAGIAEAALSKAAQEWRRGPEKFLMTDEEEKAWKGVTSDAAASAFIDLFWARRDPTPGTPRNEFREEFLERVRYADASFGEKRRRGALSDRGQVYIVLGPPEAGTRQTMEVMAPSSLSSASARGAQSLNWTWSREEAIALGVPKLAVTFNQLLGTDTFVRDTKFGQFSNVSAVANRQNIVDAAMTAAPEWALRAGAEVFSAAPGTAPRGDVRAEGRIGRVVLMGDLSALNLDSATDPIASLQPTTEFAAGSALAFVIEYCGAQGPMKLEAKINNMAAASELEPVPMKAVAGCGALPGMLSLASLAGGSYQLEITIIETNGSRLTTKQPFQLK
ncbi:MAG TPA: GWxTD domain-containing protein [Thermoanaerobaculia bacterium]|nr:GWxTD domain-containing protein [Thermoanaerobaculia bacterium]